MSFAVEVLGLAKTYGKVKVLDDVDLQIPAGTVMGLLGPNGAGKTTTVRIVTTLLRPCAGTVRVAGIDVLRDPAGARKRIGLSGQYAAVDANLSGYENLRMVARLYGMSPRGSAARAEELLATLGLEHAAHRRAGTYSGGMARRLDLAGALVARPAVVVLDEPTTGLDPRGRLDMWRVIGELVDDGTTVLLTTQYLEEADQLADQIAVLEAGRVVATGTASVLKAQIGGDTVELHDHHGELLRKIHTDGTVAGIRSALDSLDEAGAEGIVTVRRPSLDDVFLVLTAAGGATSERKEIA